MCIQVSPFETGVLRIVFCKHIESYDKQSDRQAHLGSSQTYAIAFVHRFEHVFDQRGQFGVVRSDILCHFTQHGLSVSVDR